MLIGLLYVAWGEYSVSRYNQWLRDLLETINDALKEKDVRATGNFAEHLDLSHAIFIILTWPGWMVFEQVYNYKLRRKYRND